MFLYSIIRVGFSVVVFEQSHVDVGKQSHGKRKKETKKRWRRKRKSETASKSQRDK